MTEFRLDTLRQEDVRERAHRIYIDRTCSGRWGTAESDWLEAERELREQLLGGGERFTL